MGIVIGVHEVCYFAEVTCTNVFFRVILLAFGSRRMLKLRWWCLFDDVWADVTIWTAMIMGRSFWGNFGNKHWRSRGFVDN